MIGRMIMSHHFGLAVVIVVRMINTARSRRGGVEPELCIAAGLSPLNTWTITDADSVEENTGLKNKINFITSGQVSCTFYFTNKTILYFPFSFVLPQSQH